MILLIVRNRETVSGEDISWYRFQNKNSITMTHKLKGYISSRVSVQEFGITSL
jgi:hypothetical protein